MGAAVLGLALAGAGCQADPPPDPRAPRPVAVERRYAVWHGGRRIGTVEELRIDDPTGAVTLYRARTPGGQWVGWMDGQGRCWQRVPFHADEVFRGVYSMKSGLAVLYEVESPVRLEPLDEPPSGPRTPR